MRFSAMIRKKLPYRFNNREFQIVLMKLQIDIKNYAISFYSLAGRFSKN